MKQTNPLKNFRIHINVANGKHLLTSFVRYEIEFSALLWFLIDNDPSMRNDIFSYFFLIDIYIRMYLQMAFIIYRLTYCHDVHTYQPRLKKDYSDTINNYKFHVNTLINRKVTSLSFSSRWIPCTVSVGLLFCNTAHMYRAE